MKAISLLFVALLFVGGLVVGCGSSAPDTPNALAYDVVNQKAEKRHAISRLRLRVDVVPATDAELNFKTLGDTAIRVALDKAEETGADVVFVSVFQDKDQALSGFASPLASATYVPDGGDIGGKGDMTWDVKTASAAPPEQALQVQKVWYAERGKFQKDGMTDEERLVPHIAELMGIEEDEVKLPWIYTKKYLKE